MAATYFGDNTNGDSYSTRGLDVLSGMIFQNTALTGNLSELGINLQAALTGSIRLAIYADNDGAPGALLLNAGELVNPSSGWQSKTGLTLAVTLNTYYWLCVVASASYTVYMESAINNRDYVDLVYANPLPDPFGVPGTGAQNIVMRAGVEAAVTETNVVYLIFES